LNKNEDALPTDEYQSSSEPFPSDIGNDGNIIDDDDECSQEVKLRRMNIADKMWESYQRFLDEHQDELTSEDDIDDYLDSE